MTRARLAERRAEAWGLYCRGWTQYEIAEHFGLDQSTVSDDLRTFQDALPQQTREQLIAQQLTGLAGITKRLAELAELTPPPVTAGAYGAVVLDPETSEIVRDYGGQITALREWRATLAQLAKLAGLNAADKLEVSGSVTIADSVDAELQALADQLGTTALPSGYAPAELSEDAGSADTNPAT